MIEPGLFNTQRHPPMLCNDSPTLNLLTKERTMPASFTTEAGRHATLKLTNTASGQVLTARVPGDLTDNDFASVGNAALDLIRKLTGCNCMSGRISFVVEDNFADVIRVDLSENVGVRKAS